MESAEGGVGCLKRAFLFLLDVNLLEINGIIWRGKESSRDVRNLQNMHDW